MSTDVVPRALPPGGGFPAIAEVDLFAAALSGRAERTARAYRLDYEDFARFLGTPGPGVALAQLVSWSHGTANACALAYRAHLQSRDLAAATIRRRLAALKSAVKLARQLGQVPWTLEVDPPRVEDYRDTRGPGLDGWRQVLALAKGRATSPRGRRDLAIVRLLHDLALRRGEVSGLDLADVDLARGAVHVLGKGKTARVPLTLPGSARAALADWIAARGDHPGPLFARMDRGPGGMQAGGRLTGDGIAVIVAGLGRAAGLSRGLRPHGLRHQAITTALDRTGGDVRTVQRFSRHSKVETLMRYDDNRRDAAGAVAELVADD